ncbi:MAG: ATP-dependent helicase [Nitriliruptorales bacterium]|nr:ATP-dependent helicase [Nitriliruptorales bacterium]
MAGRTSFGNQGRTGSRSTGRRAVRTTTRKEDPIATEDFRRLVQAHLDGVASEADAAVLAQDENRWIDTLEDMLDEVEENLDRVRRTVHGPERGLVIADFEGEYWRIDALLVALTGEEAAPAEQPEPQPEPRPEPAAPPGLQLSWKRGRVVAWFAGHGSVPEPAEVVLEQLAAAGAPADVWHHHDPVRLTQGPLAEAVEAPIPSTLGWLVGLGATAPAEPLAPSATWLGVVAATTVRIAAQGRMIPQLEKLTAADGKQGRASFAVRWAPALIDADELAELTRTLPGAVSVLERSRDPKVFIEAVVGDFLDVICRDAAARIEVPAPPPDPRSDQEVAEAVLARLDGEPFEAPEQRGAELMRGLQKWARPVTGTVTLRLIVQLDPPDEGDAWHLRTLAPTGRGQLKRVDAAMANSPEAQRHTMKRELDRLETIYPELRRSRHARRGEVVLSQDEAWDFMTSAGAVLVTAGFDVRVPPLSRRKPTPMLRLTSSEAQETVVGAQQLTSVRWSAVFDDVELGVDDIMRLASDARPLVKAHGRWVELDRADLQAAAAALAERADQTRLTGADMLRHALGLEGSPLGGIDLAGEGWAAELLRSAAEISEHRPTRPDGFRGELRSYQADALAWLRFLDNAGLGGCLALDMGLGKTPTMLAHLVAAVAHGPALVIAPPAVVGNWAAEAQKFVPGLRVLVHHGSTRADHEEIAQEVADAHVIITTYGTAVRDIDALDDIEWGSLVVDEAQVIKNPTSETAQQLRRLQARTRVALTGTPIENGLGDLWAILDFTNPGLMGDRASFVAQLSRSGGGRSNAEEALRTLNGVLVFRRTKMEPAIAAELPDRIDVLDHCPMTPEQIGLYQAVLDDLVAQTADDDGPPKKGAVLAAITALKQICNHPSAYNDDRGPLDGRSGKLARLDEIVDNVFAAGERLLIFTHFAQWGEKLAQYLTDRTGVPIACYHGGLARGARDRLVQQFQSSEDAGALVLSLKAGGTGLNLTAASHVVLYDRWWNPAVEDQARDRAWRIGQRNKVVAHRLVCPGTVDERVEEVVAGKRRIADLVLPASSSVDDLRGDQLRVALGIDPDTVLADETFQPTHEGAAA